MVAAVHYLATASDHGAMLDYLGEPMQVSLHPWPVVPSPPVTFTREQALRARQVMIVSAEFGPPTVPVAPPVSPKPRPSREPAEGLFRALDV